MFTRGFTNDQVAERLTVTEQTVANYRTDYERELADQLRANPSLLRNVLENTVRALGELDQARRAAWEEYEHASHDLTCPNCSTVVSNVSSPVTRNNLLNTIIKAQDQRGKLLGLFGVRQEFLMHVQSVRLLQEAILEFMRTELCPEDKAKLERLILEQLGDHIDATSSVPAIPAGAFSDVA